MTSELQDTTPSPGDWPADPQEGIPISKERIWIDGCFDFCHHGHAGAMLQARRLGGTLVVGVHSDEDILKNKGPTVMSLEERISAVDSCRWASLSVPHAPYVTSLPWISHYGCFYVVHGDDITSDSGGEDCYRFVKAVHRFQVVKRTPDISTTDLVGRMLLSSQDHHMKSLVEVLVGNEGKGSPDERIRRGEEMLQRLKDYASDETGLGPWAAVWSWQGCESTGVDEAGRLSMNGVSTSPEVNDGAGTYLPLVNGIGPRAGQRIVYVDGGFDLFSPGHNEFLRQISITEERLGHQRGWHEPDALRSRLERYGSEFPSAYIIAGIHDDESVNRLKGESYPIMNTFERGLCVLQCKYIDGLIFSAPVKLSKAYIENLPSGTPAAVYHGSTAFMPSTFDPYEAAKKMGNFQQIGRHDFQNLNAGEIVQRIMRSRDSYEERQRAKIQKAVSEEAVKRMETERNE